MPAEVYCLYVDDSGTRHPDHVPLKPGDVNWFGLGGILINERDEDLVRAAHGALYSRWPQLGSAPLHSHEIRMSKGTFSFLHADPTKREQFMADLSRFIVEAPVLGHACVIHRPGYMARYAALYGERRWLLCKTAFSVLLERAVKFVTAKSARLRVHVEKTDKDTDARMAAYYKELRATGMPFAPDTSSKYRPLGGSELSHGLYDLKFKNKSSPLIQLADLYLWPICKSGYGSIRPFTALRESNRLIDCVLDDTTRPEQGIKYSCFDGDASRARVCPP
jgi:hypothetical protein